MAGLPALNALPPRPASPFPGPRPELTSFDDRLASLAAVFPLYDLRNKHSLREFHGLELGLCLMLFILEKMLHYEPCTYEDAEGFVAAVVPRLTGKQISRTEGVQLTQKLLDELTNQGRPFIYEFHSPLDGQDHQIKFRLLEQQPLSLPDRDTVSIRLTETGLDLLFKSREIYRDLQFSVMQLYLDQQIRRGTFEGALQTVNELGVAVTTMEREVEALRDQIRRNVVEAVEAPAYQRLINRMKQQLDRERETFANLISLVRETRRNLASASSGEDERLASVERLDRRLYEVAQRHLDLFNHKLELNLLVEEALLASLRSTLTVRFHLEKEFLAEVLRQNPPGQVLTRVGLLPLLRVRLPRLLGLNTFLGPQALIGRERERPPEAVPEEMDEAARRELEAAEEERQARTVDLLQRCLRLLLEPLTTGSAVHLSRVLAGAALDGWPEEEVRAFVYLVLLLHQAGKIPAYLPWDYVPGGSDLAEFALYQLLQKEPSLAGLGVVTVAAGEGTVTLPYGIEITDLVLRRGDGDAV
ncbi:hypothetical protein GFC01_11175 [Desulfofundulus thermobenzoicus]|uniref:Uncharacterized protein n=1 Tax=Desulfofundulus thermobenzoicus TaxID=29376 RepID=A0A6N7ITC7_9FIRM|nr:hypothetical protein [Desulfofundulus thermobenzoicus]MQL52813.1 hypothetical protein [Desulfofundulus thermobenzoicus]